MIILKNLILPPKMKYGTRYFIRVYLVFIIVIVEGPGHFFNVNKFLGSILLQIALQREKSD
jgi:hypothetical protein